MQNRKTRVLIADDDVLIRSLLSILIASLDVEVCEAEDGSVALEQFQLFQPDMLVLDINMPNKNGYEVCQQLKADKRSADVPVIFITAASDDESEVHGLSLGAVDFISKPIDPAIVLARINTHLTLLATRRELQEKNLELSDEKELMEDIVIRMRNSSPFESRYVRYVQSALERTAGDIVLSAFRPNGAQHVLVGDFSGHGLPAAMGGILVPYIFYRLTAEGASMQGILQEINRVLFEQLPTQLYMAASAVELTPQRDRAAIWNYGLPATLHLTPQGRIYRVASNGIPLGISVVIEDFQSHSEISVETGDAICLLTDGITEANANAEDQFGMARVEELAMRIYQQRLPLDVLWYELERHCAGKGLSDDAVYLELMI